MKNCEKPYCNDNLYYKPFSHIYAEKEIVGSHLYKKITSKLKDSEIIEIERYKEIFSGRNHSFSLEKRSPSLILAKKEGELVYRGAPFCQNFGNENFYYTSFVLNCIYDCEYCYLRGMYPSGNIVVFVNTEDFFESAKQTAGGRDCFLCISYDTDLLALEGLLGLCRRWYDFALQNRNIKIELRTKCSNMSFLKGLEPVDNFIIALTLSPDIIWKKYENKTPSPEKRLKAAAEVIKAGFPLRLSFDPLIYCENFKDVYGGFIKNCSEILGSENISDIGLGGFRISGSYMKNMRKNYPSSLLINYPFENINGAYCYDRKISEEMTGFITEELKKYFKSAKIYLWET